MTKEEIIQKIIDLGSSNSAFRFERGTETDILINWDYQKAYALLLPITEKELKKSYTASILLDEATKTLKIFEESKKSLIPTVGGVFVFLIKLILTGKANIGMSSDYSGGSRTGVDIKKSYSLGQTIKTGSPAAVNYNFNNIALKAEIKKITKEAGYKYKRSFFKSGVLRKNNN